MICILKYLGGSVLASVVYFEMNKKVIWIDGWVKGWVNVWQDK